MTIRLFGVAINVRWHQTPEGYRGKSRQAEVARFPNRLRMRNALARARSLA